jgi:hypothetical protein
MFYSILWLLYSIEVFADGLTMTFYGFECSIKYKHGGNKKEADTFVEIRFHTSLLDDDLPEDKEADRIFVEAEAEGLLRDGTSLYSARCSKQLRVMQKMLIDELL